MSTYTKILIGLDLSNDCFKILEKAKDLADRVNAELIVCHVIESLAYAYGGDIPVNLAEAQLTLEEHAEHRLAEVLEQGSFNPTAKYVVVGDTASELRKIAADSKADLIVVGSHARHGLALILGSTASGVLHGAQCDVLAIRV